jgi:hypothetical protein
MRALDGLRRQWAASIREVHAAVAQTNRRWLDPTAPAIPLAATKAAPREH